MANHTGDKIKSDTTAYSAISLGFDDIFEFEPKELELKFRKLQLDNLLNLFKEHLSGESNQILPHPIRLLDFEMLEAELINQGILPKCGESLTQLLAREISQLKWTARSLLKNDSALELFIDVRTYFLKKASQNLGLSDTGGVSIDFLSNQELRYLDHFSAYLNGAYEDTNHPYERGLNLILKSIRRGSYKNSAKIQEDSNRVRITLPINKKSLVKLLAAIN